MMCVEHCGRGTIFPRSSRWTLFNDVPGFQAMYNNSHGCKSTDEDLVRAREFSPFFRFRL